MTNENQPNQDIERLKSTLRGLSMTQVRFVIARLENKTDKAAAEEIGISPATVKSWDNKAQIDTAVDLMRVDGMITALEIRRRNLAKAMAVKVAGLDSDDEKVRQNTATELIEWELGKAPSTVALTGENGGPVVLKVAAYDYRNAIAPIAPRPMGDSSAPGEGQDTGNGPQMGQNHDDG